MRVNRLKRDEKRSSIVQELAIGHHRCMGAGEMRLPVAETDDIGSSSIIKRPALNQLRWRLRLVRLTNT